MDNKISFEKALIGLEDIVKKLESGNLPLDESLELYEEAIALVKTCNERLEKAEERVRILTDVNGQGITDAPFALADET
ncbi:MAG: exodeoxyribonuclease VII small subunit [Clostridia bacterium]|nr:exodeoxyribonuclease VII small subunit [Clostridia bacterium]MBP3582898.1 exodeoxyribonuclease VII small subunit [Clostridia bacterium]